MTAVKHELYNSCYVVNSLLDVLSVGARLEVKREK